MVKIGVCVFATLGRLFAFGPAISQQVAIAPAHQREAGARQPNGAVAQLVGLPGSTGRNACASEQALRNDAIALAREAAVECTEREAEPRSALPCQPVRRAAVWSPNDDAPQPQRCSGARGKIRVERDDHGRWRGRARTADKYDGQATVRIGDQPIVGTRRTAFIQWSDRAEVTR